MSKAVPRSRAQRNFTDPDARIKTSDGALHECYNGQAAVDDAYQVIVAAAPPSALVVQAEAASP